MASVGPKESSMCCDSVSNNNTIFSLNDTECVPFQDKIYSPTVAKNRYGFMDKVSCDNNGIYIDFQYPRKIEKENNLYGIFYYECCRKESTQLPLYIQDSTFRSSIYPPMVVSAIAILLCVLLIVALLIPLFLNLNKKRERTTNANTTTSSNRTTITTRSKNITRANRRQTNTTVPTYSGYVLYLIFLAFPDLIMNICILIKLGEFANQKVPNFNYLNSIQMGCSTANLYINCFISYEILNLLRNSNNIARCRPPSLIKVTLQAIVVYIWSIIVFVAYYFTQKIQIQARDAGNDEKKKILNTVNLIWSMTVSFVIPIIFFCHIWLTIWHRGYITMSSVTGTMKELVWYFFRIVIIFNLIWLPGMFLLVFGGSNPTEYSNLIFIGGIFVGIEPIASFCLAMMKSDVRKYVIDLLTLSYICKTPESTPTTVDDELEIAC